METLNILFKCNIFLTCLTYLDITEQEYIDLKTLTTWPSITPIQNKINKITYVKLCYDLDGSASIEINKCQHTRAS